MRTLLALLLVFCEQEPNDWHMTANYQGTTSNGVQVCGTIDADDKDWFVWRISPTDTTGLWNKPVTVTAKAHTTIRLVMFQRLWMNGQIGAVVYYGYIEGESIKIDLNIIYREGILTDFLVLVLSEEPTNYILSCEEA